MEYTNENCICIGERKWLAHGVFRAYYCPIDGAFFWTLGDVESGYEKIFGESAEEVIAEMGEFCLHGNQQTFCILGL